MVSRIRKTLAVQERAAAFERRSEIEADAADEEQLQTRRASDSGN